MSQGCQAIPVCSVLGVTCREVAMSTCWGRCDVLNEAGVLWSSMSVVPGCLPSWELSHHVNISLDEECARCQVYICSLLLDGLPPVVLLKSVVIEFMNVLSSAARSRVFMSAPLRFCLGVMLKSVALRSECLKKKKSSCPGWRSVL